MAWADHEKLAPTGDLGDTWGVRIVILVLLALGIVLGASGAATARKEHVFSYPFTRVWEAAVRLVRVDLACAVGEKNREDGYFLFEYAHDGKTHPGSVEIVRSGPTGVRVVVQVPAMPSYVERMILDKLARKLSSEYGAPPAPMPAQGTPAAPPADAASAEAKPAAPEGKAEAKPTRDEKPAK